MEPSNWQTQLSTIRERNEYAFNNSLFYDVEFLVQDSNGDQVTVPANKYVLAISSPVFKAMFYGELANNGPIIELPNCTKEGLHELLRYVYSNDVELTGSTCMEVLYLADFYNMPFLVEKCKRYLENELGPDDVLSILPQVQKMGDEELQNHLWGIVDRETLQSISAESFLNISREMLSQILERETLQINELDLFRAVDRWAEKKITEKGLESNGETRRWILGEEVIRLIRFPVMTQKEFAEVVLPSEILKKDEVLELVQWYSEVPATDLFRKEKRCLTGLFFPSNRFVVINPPQPGGPWSYPIGQTDAIDFSTNKAVYLVGVRMFGSNGSTYEVNLQIYKGDQVISQLSSFFLTESEMINDLYYGFTVSLDKPVKLDPGVEYTVEAQISGPSSYYGDLRSSNTVLDGVEVNYTHSSRSSNLTSFDRGQFPSIILRKI